MPEQAEAKMMLTIADSASMHTRADAVPQQSDTVLMDDIEPHILDCSDMAREGKWRLRDCCAECHEGLTKHKAALDIDLGGGGAVGTTRLRLCCAAGGDPAGGAYAKLLVEREK